MSDLPTLQQLFTVEQICKAARVYEESARYWLDRFKEAETANANLQRAVIEDERTITRLQRELADVTRERDRLRAVTRRAKSGQRRRARVRARA